MQILKSLQWGKRQMKKSRILDLNPSRTICSARRCYASHFSLEEKRRNEQNKLTNAMQLWINKGNYVLCFETSSFSTYCLLHECRLRLVPESGTLRGHTHILNQLQRDQQCLPFQISLRKIGLFSQMEEVDENCSFSEKKSC